MLGLPRDLQPPWRAVPRLVWTLARADALAPGWLGAVQAVASGVFVTAPTVVSARAVGQLASQNGHALLVVRLDDSPPRRRVRRLVAVAVGAVPWTVALVAFVIGSWQTADVALPASEPVRVTTAAGLTYLVRYAAGACVSVVADVALVALFAVVVLPRWSVVRETMGAFRQEREARARHGISRGTSVYLEAYAAWPRRRGHGRELLQRVRPVAEAAAAATGRPIMVVARNTRLVEVYREFGLAPIAPGSLVLVSRPGS
jgi:hypothetical protein